MPEVILRVYASWFWLVAIHEVFPWIWLGNTSWFHRRQIPGLPRDFTSGKSRRTHQKISRYSRGIPEIWFVGSVVRCEIAWLVGGWGSSAAGREITVFVCTLVLVGDTFRLRTCDGGVSPCGGGVAQTRHPSFVQRCPLVHVLWGSCRGDSELIVSMTPRRIASWWRLVAVSILGLLPIWIVWNVEGSKNLGRCRISHFPEPKQVVANGECLFRISNLQIHVFSNDI